jgi:hypothetical protein
VKGKGSNNIFMWSPWLSCRSSNSKKYLYQLNTIDSPVTTQAMEVSPTAGRPTAAVV